MKLIKFTKSKTIIISIAFAISGFVLGACGEQALAANDYPLKIWKENTNGQMETWKVVDDKTGVNYIVVVPNWNSKGCSYDGVTITPRLNADGTLYVSERSK